MQHALAVRVEYGDSAGVFDEPWPALPPWWDRHQFPDSDGRPVADNDPQLDAIVMLRLGLRDHFADRDDVYVAADLLWYVNRDDSRINVAPDTMVIFGRPPHSRRSYKQWEEGGIGPSVVFEVISHRSTAREMTKKLQFYDEHDVAEYYVYDPEAGTLQGWQRLADGLRLVDIWPVDGHVSPRLGICMSLDGIALALVDETSGRRFPTAAEVSIWRTPLFVAVSPCQSVPTNGLPQGFGSAS